MGEKEDLEAIQKEIDKLNEVIKKSGIKIVDGTKDKEERGYDHWRTDSRIPIVY